MIYVAARFYLFGLIYLQEQTEYLPAQGCSDRHWKRYFKRELIRPWARWIITARLVKRDLRSHLKTEAAS